MTTQASPATEEYLQAVYTLADEGGQVIGARLADVSKRLQAAPGNERAAELIEQVAAGA